MRRFYKCAEASNLEGNWIVAIDGKPIITPLKNKFTVSSEELAKAIAEEWNAQDKEIITNKMPLTQLANTLIDKVSNKHQRIAMNEEVVKFATSDLVCYFAESPDELVEMQNKHWLPLTKWIEEEFDIEFKSITGIQYIDQEKGSIDKARKIIKNMSPIEFTVMQNLTPITGSFVISLALVKGYINAEEAYSAAFVDDAYQLQKWGSDEELEKRLKLTEEDIKISKRFYDIS